jgi:hypothetical protein
VPTRKKKLVEDDEQETQTEESQAEVETKPKRKAVRRKKVVSTDEIVPPRPIDAVEQSEEPEVMEEAVVIEAEEVIVEEDIAEEKTPEPVHARNLHRHGEHAAAVAATHFHPRRDGMSKAQPVEEVEKISDIRPRIHKPQTDAAFLAPEKFGFDLREKHMKRKSQTKWLKGFFYFLGTLIILTAVALFLLSAYSTRLLDTQTENPTTTEEQNPTAPISGQYAIVNAEKELSDKLSGLISNKFGTELTFDSSALPTLPQAEADTLFYRSQAQEQANSLQAYLNELGIKPQLQINDQMNSDIALYLVNILSQPDLSSQTTTVYNATETTGLAKKNCDLLTSWKAASCQPLNATTAQNGTTISYKSDKAYFNLKRTNEFKGAKFGEADSAQVQDIVVTLGN